MSEIKDLLGIVDRSLADIKGSKAVSTDLRFITAFQRRALCRDDRLRASGLRTVTQAGHHVKTIESLETHHKGQPKVIQRFKTSTIRGTIGLRRCGAVSDQELGAMVKPRRN